MNIDVLTIGSATKDVFLKVPDSNITKNPSLLHSLGFNEDSAQCLPVGSKLDIKEFVDSTGGGATNTATTFARQGFKTACIGMVGDDVFGKEIIKDLKSNKIISKISVNKKLHTDYSTVIITKEGSRTVLVNRGASGMLAKKDLKLSSLKPKWTFINPSNIDISVIDYAIKTLKKKKSKIAINFSGSYLKLGPKKLKNILANVDLVIVNREEASLLTGVPQNNDKKIFAKFDEITPGLAVMTDGPKGLTVSDGTILLKAGIFKNKKVLDRTGAGDAFGSGFVAGLLIKNDIEHAIRLGSANATSVVEYIGSKKGIITSKEFKGSKRWKNLHITKKEL